ncbi:NUT family member 1 [Tachyglossus aculeatus]|uniref:NUT family member 1 n=1 Tax=Tachyglossus aculeatus TaxID=9261 RepID=UPI0018F302E0|nr:NUT family member 1 [Tachyglossus aculeatus]
MAPSPSGSGSRSDGGSGSPTCKPVRPAPLRHFRECAPPPYVTSCGPPRSIPGIPSSAASLAAKAKETERDGGLVGQKMATKLSCTPCPALPDTLIPPAQPPWKPLTMFPLASPLLQPVFPGMMLLPGHRAAAGVSAPGRVVFKVQADGHPEEALHTQTFVLTQTTLNCVTPGPHALPNPEGIPPHFPAPSNVKTTMLLAKAPPAPLPRSVPQNQAWAAERGPRGWGLPSGPPNPRTELGNLSCTSKGVYENFRRWQHYKILARMYLPCSPDTEALACFLIPVLRSLARLKPTMTIEEALARAVQEWERNSNFERMIFYEMGEKFMEFEAEEEMQRMQLSGGCLYPILQAFPKVDPSGLPDPDACQQQVCTPPKVAFQIHHQHHAHQGPLPPPLPQESPQEAVTQCADVMAGLTGARQGTALGQWQEKPEEAEEAEKVEVEEVEEMAESEESEEGAEEAKEEVYLDPGLLRYMEELCTQDAFVSKVEAVIHPRFLAEVLSPELQRDPLALSEELEQEEGLTPAQLVQKRFLALREEGGGAGALQLQGDVQFQPLL